MKQSQNSLHWSDLSIFLSIFTTGYLSWLDLSLIPRQKSVSILIKDPFLRYLVYASRLHLKNAGRFFMPLLRLPQLNDYT
jgi:hypothetical protein